jgi:hypothetical protein
LASAFKCVVFLVSKGTAEAVPFVFNDKKRRALSHKRLIGMFFVKLPQNRHPERSAPQIDRVTQRLWRGVEEPVLSVAEGTSVVLNYPCCSGLFNHQLGDGR